MINSIFFIIFSTILVFSGIFALACKNMVYTILWSMVVFLMTGGLYVLLNATYNAAAQFLIYVVLVPLLLAVTIMFIDNKQPRLIMGRHVVSFVGIICLILIIGEYLSLNSDIFEVIKVCHIYQNMYLSIESISKNLLGVYPVLFLEFAACMFVVVMGAAHYEK